MALEAIGVSADEERVYRLLLTRPRTTVEDMARVGDMPATQLTDALVALEGKGLVSRSADSPTRFVPAPPQLAVEALVLARQHQLEQTRMVAAELQEAFRVGTQGTRSEPSELVEVVTGADAMLRRFEQLQRAANEEVAVFDKPPYAHDALNEVELELLGSGIRYRAVYDHTALEHPSQLDWLRELVAAGEQARATADVPIKLTIADGRLGLVPLSLDAAGVQGAVLIHPSPLLDGFIRLFEMIWDRATPVPLKDPGALSPDTTDALDDEVLLLLAGGLSDQQIARQLGVSYRTAQRRARTLIEALGAVTRFQAGWMAAHRHLPEPRPQTDDRLTLPAPPASEWP